MAENYYNSTLTAAQIEAVLAGVNGVTGLVKRKADGTFEAGSEASEVFVALYGTTTADQVEAAYQAGKVVVCIDGQFVYSLMNRVNSASFVFINWSQINYYGNQSDYPEYRRITLNANVWSSWLPLAVERVDGKKTQLDSYSTDVQYPSAKCVYDALLLKADAADLTAHTEATDNPHAVTKAQVGLGSVDNTADADKPVSTAQQTALDLKAPLESPALTGMPTAPTAAEGTDNTQIATTAFAKAVAESKAADVAALVSVASAADVQAVLEV